MFAQPWWANLLILVPIIAYLVWRRNGIRLTRRQLLLAAVFGIAFGVVETAVVVYLRAALELLPGGSIGFQTPEAIGPLAQGLFTIEVVRETATMVMLLALAVLAVRGSRERAAMFLWTFAVWDIVYYAGLRAFIGWPTSLADPDVLFLVPVPWVSPVWFPLAVSAGVLLAVVLTRKDTQEQ